MTKIISVSIPDALRDTLDAEAIRQKRSRSWVVSEAVARYVVEQREAAFDESRDHVLRAGLALTPAERVLEAEAIWREFADRHPPTRGWTAAFDSFAEYEQWRRFGGGQA